MTKSLIIGLLGGIGSGKSTVSRVFAQYGASVLDADQCAGEVLLESRIRQEIRKTLGNAVFGNDGYVDRAKLAARIFTHPEDLKKVNAIIHPRVRRLFRKAISEIQDKRSEKIIVLDIPLLLGSELISSCDRLIMVKAPLKTRQKRVRESRGWDSAELERREACQPSLAEKEAAADFVIENNGTIEALRSKIEGFLKNTGTV